MVNRDINNVVVSSRVRLARNIEGLAFPLKLDVKTARAIPHNIYSELAKTDSYNLYRMSEIGAVDGAALMEKHLISADLLKNKEGGSVIINDSESVSIMINEEDHVREQCILPGSSLINAYDTINKIDDLLMGKNNFAFHDTLGFLTACPTNLGTGMRASVMMFLPGLASYKSLEAVANAASRLDMTVRGVYGEGSGSAGFMFQISNSKSLGFTEPEIIKAVDAAAAQIAEAEFKARDNLLTAYGVDLRDKIMRAYGTLTNSYKLSGTEFMELIAYVKLGAYYGFLSITDNERFDRLITAAQPANMIQLAAKDISEAERDIFRAAFVTKNLLSLTNKG